MARRRSRSNANPELDRLRKLVEAASDSGRRRTQAGSLQDRLGDLSDTNARWNKVQRDRSKAREKRRKELAEQADELSTELGRLSASGSEGAAQAKALYDKLMKADFSAEDKARFTRIAEGQENPENAQKRGGLWGALGAALSPVESILHAVGTPMRAVAAGIDEGMGALYRHSDSESFLDKAWRDRDYGWGKLWENAKEIDRQRKGGGDAKADLFGWEGADNNKWLGRAVGLAGDIGADPLTYATVGAGTAVSKGSRAAKAGLEATKGARAADAAGTAERAIELAEAASRSAERVQSARRATKLGRKQVATRLAEAGLDDAAARVAKRGASAATAQELRQAGLEGGLALKGRVVVGHDTTRKATGAAGRLGEVARRPFQPLGRVLGRDDLKELRRVAREGIIKESDGTLRRATVTEIGDALRQIPTKQRGVMRSKLVAEAGSKPLAEALSAQAERAGVDQHVLYRAVTGHVPSREVVEAQSPGLVDAVRNSMDELRGMVNESGVRGTVADAGDDYLARQVTDDFREWAEATGRWRNLEDRYEPTTFRKGNEKRAYRAGDEFEGQVLGSPELHARFSPDYEPGSRGAIEAQMDGLLHAEGMPEGIRMFEQDAFGSAARTASTAVRRAGELAQARGLVEAGVAVPMRRPELEPILDRLGQRLERSQSKLAEVLGADPGDWTSPRIDSALRYMYDDKPEMLGRLEKKLARVRQGQAEFDTLGRANLMLAEGDDAISQAVQATTEAAEAAASRFSETGEQRFADAAELLNARQGKLERALVAQDPGVRQVAVLGAEADRLEAELLVDGRRAAAVPDSDKFISQLRHEGPNGRFGAMLRDGFTSMGDLGLPGYEMPTWNYEAMARAVEVAEDPSGFWKAFDKANRHFKTYALFSPGFHVRNYLGGMFNNYVDGVKAASYGDTARMLKAFRKGDWSGLGKAEREFMDEAVGRGFLSEDLMVSSEFPQSTAQRALVEAGDLNVSKPRSQRMMVRAGNAIEGNPAEAGLLRRAAAKVTRGVGLNENALTNLSSEAGNMVEQHLRLTQLWDNVNRGLDMDEAIEKVHMFHFDYADLSRAEQTWARRVVPFWTWTSRNLPLQLAQAATNPKAYNQFRAVQRNLKSDDPNDTAFHPGYLKYASSSIQVGDVPLLGRVADYYRPDLPFQGVDDTFRAISEAGPAGVLGDMTPLLRVPLERQLGTQVFNGAPITDDGVPLPEAWGWLAPALGMLPGSYRRKDGRLMLNGKDFYAIDQAMPHLGRARRLVPGDDSKAQQRQLSSLLSFFGVGTSRVTDSDRNNEAYRILEALEGVRSKAMDQGVMPTREEAAAVKEAERAAKKLKREREKRDREAERKRKENEKKMRELKKKLGGG